MLPIEAKTSIAGPAPLVSRIQESLAALHTAIEDKNLDALTTLLQDEKIPLSIPDEKWGTVVEHALRSSELNIKNAVLMTFALRVNTSVTGTLTPPEQKALLDKVQSYVQQVELRITAILMLANLNLEHATVVLKAIHKRCAFYSLMYACNRAQGTLPLTNNSPGLIVKTMRTLFSERAVREGTLPVTLLDITEKEVTTTGIVLGSELAGFNSIARKFAVGSSAFATSAAQVFEQMENAGVEAGMQTMASLREMFSPAALDPQVNAKFIEALDKLSKSVVFLNPRESTCLPSDAFKSYLSAHNQALTIPVSTNPVCDMKQLGDETPTCAKLLAIMERAFQQEENPIAALDLLLEQCVKKEVAKQGAERMLEGVKLFMASLRIQQELSGSSAPKPLLEFGTLLTEIINKASATPVGESKRLAPAKTTTSSATSSSAASSTSSSSAAILSQLADELVAEMSPVATATATTTSTMSETGESKTTESLGRSGTDSADKFFGLSQLFFSTTATSGGAASTSTSSPAAPAEASTTHHATPPPAASATHSASGTTSTSPATENWYDGDWCPEGIGPSCSVL